MDLRRLGLHVSGALLLLGAALAPTLAPAAPMDAARSLGLGLDRLGRSSFAAAGWLLEHPPPGLVAQTVEAEADAACARVARLPPETSGQSGPLPPETSGQTAPSSYPRPLAAAPPLGAAWRLGVFGTPRERVRATGRQPPPRVREPAACAAADLAALLSL